METFFILAIIATFFSSAILSIGRIVGSHEFKESHFVAFLTILNLVSVLSLGLLAVTSTVTLQTPFVQMLLFSIAVTIVAVHAALSRVPDELVSESSTEQSVVTETLTTSPAPVVLQTNLPNPAPHPGRSKTKPVIAKGILNDIHDSNGGTALVTHDEVIEELTGR